MKNKIKSALVLLSFAIFLFASCSQNSDTVQDKQNDSDFVAVSFTTVASAKSRSMVPDLSDENNSFFNDSHTVYKLEGESDTDEPFCNTYDLDGLENASLYLRKGNWTFTLSVYEAAAEEDIVVAYEATAEVELTDETETIRFTLEPCTGEDVKGNIQFYFTIPEGFVITDDFYAKLLDSENEEIDSVNDWENSDEESTYFVYFDEVPVGTYRIELNLPSETTYTEWTRTGTETCSDNDRTVSINNIRNEFGVLVMPNLLTSNKESPREYSQLNVLNQIKYFAGFMDSDDDYNTENIDTDGMVLYYNSALQGYVELREPKASETKDNYIFSYYQTVSDDDDGNTCYIQLESRTENGTTVWLLPRNAEFTQIDAVYYKTDCRVSIDIGDVAQWQEVSDEDLTIVGQYDSEITLPGSDENTPALNGWTFVGFSTEVFDYDETITEENYESRFEDITFVKPGQQYRISKTEENLYPYWYFNGQCSLDLENSVYKAPDSAPVSLSFDDENYLELTNMNYGTSLSLVAENPDTTILYKIYDENVDNYSLNFEEFAQYTATTKIMPTEAIYIKVIVKDSTEYYADSPVYTIRLEINASTTQFTVTDFKFTLSEIEESGENNEIYTIKILDSNGEELADYYANLFTIVWSINGIEKTEETETSITIDTTTEMELKTGENIVEAKITYKELLQIVDASFTIGE